VFGSIVWPKVNDEYPLGSFLADLASPVEIRREVDGMRGDALVEFRRNKDAIRQYTEKERKAELNRRRAELEDVRAKLEKNSGFFASVRPSAILERKRLELREARLEGVIGLLKAAGKTNAEYKKLHAVMVPTEAAVSQARKKCIDADNQVDRFNRLNAIERSVNNILHQEADALTKSYRKKCDNYKSLKKRREDGVAEARRLMVTLNRAEAAYETQGAEGEAMLAKIENNLPAHTVRDILIQAAVWLAVIVATPFLIRLLFFFVLAPFAERRAAIRLRTPGGAGPTSLAAERSSTSAPVRLARDEELLVRQGYLQATSSAGSKATRALLDWRHPLSSLASGLVFLTCVRGEGETTTVSAVHDPFAEVSLLRLPDGAACVLHPRALAAVVHPIDRPLRITSHWRLGSLNAWLTMQLRYLVFHGPAGLVIKGGRGVRVERAERGRIFGQDQLVGFSADLAYSVTRTETFWPYFLGREQLLKDKVEAGEGVLIVEEAPMAGRKGEPRKGLEGALDAALKVVGV
jgi:hypothetical protein